jgi:hypothetical protein
MNFARPRSVLGLILAGFTLVALPLILAVYRGANHVEQLSVQSETLVLYAVQVTRESEQLVELLTDMERYGRQYEVLAETPLLQLYEEKHNAFLAALGTPSTATCRAPTTHPWTPRASPVSATWCNRSPPRTSAPSTSRWSRCR